MKKLFLVLTAFMMAVCSCTTDYYEPSFGIDNLPAVIPASGGKYYVDYSYSRYDTRAAYDEYFEWEYRVVICESVVSTQKVNGSTGDSFLVEIPRNDESYPRPVFVEASVHYVYDRADWWSDWEPVASGVQLCY